MISLAAGEVVVCSDLYRLLCRDNPRDAAVSQVGAHIGHEQLFRGISKEPATVHSFLETLDEFHLEYHTAVEGKAHGLVILDPVAATETASPPQYEEFVLPSRSTSRPSLIWA